MSRRREQTDLSFMAVTDTHGRLELHSVHFGELSDTLPFGRTRLRSD